MSSTEEVTVKEARNKIASMAATRNDIETLPGYKLAGRSEPIRNPWILIPGMAAALFQPQEQRRLFRGSKKSENAAWGPKDEVLE